MDKDRREKAAQVMQNLLKNVKNSKKNDARGNFTAKWETKVNEHGRISICESRG